MKLKWISALLFFSLSLLSLTACQTQEEEKPPASGTVLFADDFSAETHDHHWTSLANENGVMGYDSNGFRFYIREAGVDFWATPANEQFTDVRIEADALQYAGSPENRIGLICRYQNDQNFYFFVISTDGYYAIGKMKAGKQELLGQKTMQYNAAIQPELMINHLRAECQDDVLRFYVNDTLLNIVNDADFAEGNVGLLAGTFGEGGLDVLFDDFRVIQP